MNSSFFAAALFSAFLLMGCRPDPGVPEYLNAEDFSKQGAAPAEPLDGPDPFVVGEARLSLGAFYEGGSSQQIPIDDISTHFYIYGLESDMTPTFSIKSDKDVVQEGLVSDRVLHGGTPWWGGGIHWDSARDLSEWTTLFVSFYSSDEAFAKVEIQVQTEDGQDPEKVAETAVDAADYGYANDGAWYHLAIPLADFSMANWKKVRAPFVMVGASGEKGAALYVDNVYLSKD
jgi:hypothetical protein